MSTETRQNVVPVETALIGVENLEPPNWARGDIKAANASIWRTISTTPTTLRVIFRFSWSSAPSLTILALALNVVSGCVTTFGLLATTQVLTQLLEAGPTPERLVAALPAVALVVGANSIRALLDTAVALVQGTLKPRIGQAAQHALNVAVADVDLASFDDADFRELVRQGSRNGVSSLESSVRLMTDMMSSLISLAAAIVTAGLLNPWLSLVLWVAAIADGWAAMRVAKLGLRSYLQTVTRRTQLEKVANLLVARDVALERHAFTLQGRLSNEYRRIAHGITKTDIRVARNQNMVRLIGRALAGIGTGIAYFVLGLLLYLGALPLALAGTAVIAMNKASGALSNAMYAMNNLYEHSFYVDFYQELLEDCKKRYRRPVGVSAPTDPEEIRLENVSFKYPGTEELVLRGIDLTIRRGEIIALVGMNGSGKTTLGKVLTGLYLPTTGRVWWDDVDIATADPNTLYEQISIVSQDPARWPMTANLNIRVGRLDWQDPDRLTWREALTKSRADEVISSLEFGENSLLSKEFKGGVELSGGQWQRIGVARGMYRDSAILIADEPTAALDAKAEAVVFDGLQQTTRRGAKGEAKRTIILVTHRLANIRGVDRIVVLDKGKIVEQGTHQELMANNGLYCELFTLQAKAYSDLDPEDGLLAIAE